MGSSLLGELWGFAVSYRPTRSGAAFRRCSARASAQSAPLGASLVIGQPLLAAGAGVGTAQLSRRPVHRLDPHLGPRRGWIHPWRSERLVPRLVGARRLAAPDLSDSPVASRCRVLETPRRRYAPPRRWTRNAPSRGTRHVPILLRVPSNKLPARQHDALRFRGRAAEREVEHEEHDDDGGRGAHGHVLPVLAARREVCGGGTRRVGNASRAFHRANNEGRRHIPARFDAMP